MRGERAEWAVSAFAGALLVANCGVIAAAVVLGYGGGAPLPRSGGSRAQLLSNLFYVLPLLPFAVRMRPARRGGLGADGRGRAGFLIIYTIATAAVSTLHHAMLHDASAAYAGTGVPVLWRSLDWSLARLSIGAGGFAMVGVADLARVAAPGDRNWHRRMAIRLLGSAALAVCVLNDARNVAVAPFSQASIYQAAALGGCASALPVVAAICVGGRRVSALLAASFLGHPHGWPRTLSLLVCVAAAVATHAASDDGTGAVHTLWHFATASVISATVAVLRDRKGVAIADPMLGVI